MGTRYFSLIIQLFIGILLPSWVQAEGIVVSGLVKDNQGKPIPFANVIIEQTAKGCSTDTSGHYTLTLHAGTYTLIASAVGFSETKQTLQLQSDTVCHFVLTESAVDLQSVKVTAKTSETH